MIILLSFMGLKVFENHIKKLIWLVNKIQLYNNFCAKISYQNNLSNYGNIRNYMLGNLEFFVTNGKLLIFVVFVTFEFFNLRIFVIDFVSFVIL